MLMIAYIEGLNNSWLTNLTWKAFVYATHPQQWYCAVYWIITTVREGCGVLIDCLRLVNRRLSQQWYWIITTVLGVDKLPGSCGKSLVAAVVLHGAQDYIMVREGRGVLVGCLVLRCVLGLYHGERAVCGVLTSCWPLGPAAVLGNVLATAT